MQGAFNLTMLACIVPVQIDDLKGTGSAVLQLQADIAELRLAPRGERNSSPSVEHLQGLFVTQDALKAVAGELQVRDLQSF